MSDELAQFLGAGQALAERQLPAVQAQREETGSASRVQLGLMLAQVAILPDDSVDRIYLRVFGDPEMASALRCDVVDGVLVLEGELPFKPGRFSGGSGFGGGNFFSGDVSIVGGRIYGSNVFVSGDSTAIMDGRIIVNGREVDLDRRIFVAMMVPRRMDVLIPSSSASSASLTAWMAWWTSSPAG